MYFIHLLLRLRCYTALPSLLSAVAMKTISAQIVKIDDVLDLSTRISDNQLDLVLTLAKGSDSNDIDSMKKAIAEKAVDFDTGLAKAVEMHDLTRALGVPEDTRKKALTEFLENFDELLNSSNTVLRIYAKTQRIKLVNDNQSVISIKRCREEEKAGEKSVSEPKSKATKPSTKAGGGSSGGISAPRKVPVSEVQDIVKKVVDGFELIVNDLCDEVKRLRDQVDRLSRCRGSASPEVSASEEEDDTE